MMASIASRTIKRLHPAINRCTSLRYISTGGSTALLPVSSILFDNESRRHQTLSSVAAAFIAASALVTSSALSAKTALAESNDTACTDEEEDIELDDLEVKPIVHLAEEANQNKTL